MCKMYILTTFKQSAEIINHKAEHFNHKSLTINHIFHILNFEFTRTSSEEILIGLDVLVLVLGWMTLSERTLTIQFVTVVLAR